MLDFNEELEKFQPCADLEDAEENFDGDELEQIKQNKTELYKANQMIKKYNQALNYAKQGNEHSRKSNAVCGEDRSGLSECISGSGEHHQRRSNIWQGCFG